MPPGLPAGVSELPQLDVPAANRLADSYASIRAIASERPYTIIGPELRSKPPQDVVNKPWLSSASAFVYALLLS